MTMETRCSKVIFPNYSKKKPAEDTICSQKRYQAVGFPCNRMLKLSSTRGIRIDVPVLSVSWSFEDHSVIIQALRKGLRQPAHP